MKINDETLSAFLDNELSEAEMETVREAMIEDEALAEQLAELASADAAVINTYSEIDGVPLPQSIKDLLDEQNSEVSKASKTGNNVVSFPLWKRTINKLAEVKSLAAAAAVAAIVLSGNLLLVDSDNSNNKTTQFALINQVLDSQASGMPITSGDQEILVRASFKSKTGDYCRQFKLTQASASSEKIACKQQNTWQVVASSESKPVNTEQNNQYQTATGQGELDAEIDRLIDGQFYNQEQEKLLIEQDWNIQ